jgi:peptide/nickel transport system ATP-binding protein
VARAFAGRAKVVVADEPVSALDVSVQAAVTELLMDIQRESKTTMLFISHDLSVVRYIADRVVVMYLGYIVEQGTTDQIFSPPYHPYTEALLSAIPIADTSVKKKHIVLEGDIPSAMNPPPGCPFQTRCRYKPLVPGNLCETQVPPFRELGGGHRSLCWLPDEVLAQMEPVITFGRDREENAAVADAVPEDAPHGVGGEGPGYAGPAPQRPHGKLAEPAAGMLAAAVEEREAVLQSRREESGDPARSLPGLDLDRNSAINPAQPLQSGDGRQAVDPHAPPAFRSGEAGPASPARED